MASPWDKLDHSLLVLDYSKLLVGLAVHSAGLVGGAMSFHLAQKHLDADAKLDKLICDWERLLQRLTPEDRARIEAAKPGAIAELEAKLDGLRSSLSYLNIQLQSTKYWQRLWPYSDIFKDIKEVWEEFNSAGRDFTETTRAVFKTRDAVDTVLAAANAAASEADVELSSLPPGNRGLADVSAMPASPTSIVSGSEGTPAQVEQDVPSIYRWAVATTAALLPAVLRRTPRSNSQALPA
ncbi:hypothetical protein OH77DRAFT_1430862 [Trametes cingulata]|nr:hypothetical protein OH77DRAFT_1430862 [Trametes cingulata]